MGVQNCGCMNDRDLNASINIMSKGIEMYLGGTISFLNRYLKNHYTVATQCCQAKHY